MCIGTRTLPEFSTRFSCLTAVSRMNQYINRDLNYDRDFDLISLNLYIDVPD